MKHITSSANAAVRCVRKLLQKKGRDTYGAFIIEGSILISDAVRAGMEIEHVFLRGSSAGGLCDYMTHELLRSLSQRGVEVASLSEDIFDGIADTVTPKGMIAVAKKPHRPLEGRRMRGESKSCFLNSDALLVLDRIQDPGNVGTIIRTADAIGIGGVVCVKGTADPFSPKGVRAAAGALFRIPVHELGEPGDALDKLRLSGYRIAAVDANAIAPCWGTDLSGRVALVMGNEGSGLSSCFVDAVDIAIHIPMEEGAESLNVAVAAAIVAYERYRQIADLKGFGE